MAVRASGELLWKYSHLPCAASPVHDFHATVLHLLGFDHDRFTFRYQGLDQRLTGVEPAHVVKEFLA